MNMKQITLTIVITLIPLMVSADIVEVNGIYYNLISKMKTAEVTINPQQYHGDVYIPDSIIYDGTWYHIKTIAKDAFAGNYNLTSISIPNSVTTIKSAAFASCRNLTRLTLGRGVTKIEEQAFFYTSLSHVYISDLSAWCRIKSDDYSFSAPHLYINNEEVHDLIIPEDVTSIAERAFVRCESIFNVTIKNTLDSIGDAAFSFCQNLESVQIANKVSYIGSGCFEYCKKLYKIELPSGIEKIKGGTFCECSNLTIVSGGNNVKSIEDSSFEHCGSLTTITIPSEVKNIGGNAFNGCISLKEIRIPNKVETIGSGAFYNCSGIKLIILGEGLKNIEFSAFEKCSNIENVFCYSEYLPETERDVFKDSYVEYATLHVPVGSVDAYNETEPWSTFKDILPIAVTKYNLNYIIDGQVYKTYNLAEGSIITSEPIPSKEGWTFSGWSDIPETMPSHDVEISGHFFLLGDANSDGMVNIGDIVEIINYMNNRPSEKFDQIAANVTGDNSEVNEDDIAAILNIIMESER